MLPKLAEIGEVFVDWPFVFGAVAFVTFVDLKFLADLTSVVEPPLEFHCDFEL